MFAQLLNFTPNGINHQYMPIIFSLMFQQTAVYFTFILFTLFIVSVLISNLFVKKTSFAFNFIKNASVLVMGFIFLCVFCKFVLYSFNYRTYEVFIASRAFTTLKFNYLYSTPSLSLNGSILSDAVVLLAFSSGLTCVYLLGEKNLSKYLSNVNTFSIFLIAIILMVYTTNLLVMFVSFELLFIPTIYFIYSHGYVERVDKTLRILLYWTLCGAFLVLCSLSYLYFKYKTLNYYYLGIMEFSYNENLILFIMIFLGFGVKIPVFPFHYWLTKIHVEAPAGFSIFLSGFLVKAALYCFYFFNLIFNFKLGTQLVTAVAIFGIVESSIKMWTQTDFKKLIAFATIQEMNLILYLLVNSQNVLEYSLVLFILIHGWLSTLMFLWVDIIQKKTSSRNIVYISGLGHTFPEIRYITWVIILLFSGFPLTIKFVIEWQVLATLVLNPTILVVFVFFVVIVTGGIGFVKQMLLLLYGLPKQDSTVNTTLSKRDKYLLYYTTALLISLNILNFFLG